jgi:hypothetical protein
LLTSGTPSGIDLILDDDAATAPEMTQWQPGLFRYTTAGAPFTRGLTYRATYTPYLGGAAQTAITQDFIAHSDDTAPVPGRANSYTTLGLRNIVRRSLGLQEQTATVTGMEPGSANSLDIVNDALERVWREHRWQFQMGEPVYGEIIANQSRYPLPDDFMELIAVTRPVDRLHKFVRADFRQIRAMRERSLSDPIHKTYYDVVSDPPALATGYTRYALELYPTPTGYLQAGYVLDYYRECPKMCEDTDIPPFPLGFHSLLKQAVRVEAFEQENDSRAVGEIQKYERLLVAAKDNDGRHMDTNLGSLINARPGGDAFDNIDLHHDWGWSIPSD